MKYNIHNANMKKNIQNLNNLLKKLDFINIEKMKSNETVENTELYYPSEKQFLFGDIEKNLPTLNILYKEEEEGGMKEKWILFSYPSRENMYIIYLESDMFGVADYISAEVYDSLEIYYTKLLKLLKRDPGIMRRTENMTIKNFISIFF